MRIRVPSSSLRSEEGCNPDNKKDVFTACSSNSTSLSFPLVEDDGLTLMVMETVEDGRRDGTSAARDRGSKWVEGDMMMEREDRLEGGTD